MSVTQTLLARIPQPSQHWLASGLIFVVLPLLLLFGDAPGSRLTWVRTSWDMGHVLLFFLWSHLLFRLCQQKIKYWPAALVLVLVSVFMMLVGWLIEVLQAFAGRSYSNEDLLRDGAGILLAVAWSPQMAEQAERLRRAARLCALLSVLFLSKTWILLSIDGVVMLRQFPILFAPEDKLSESRFHGNALTTRISDGAARKWLEVRFTTAKFSNLELIEMVSDWQQYQQLHMEWFNPDERELLLRCRIHDRQHESKNQSYSDRFNTQFVLQPGYHKLSIALAKVQQAPRKRDMEMTHIRSLLCFSYKLEQPRTVWLGKVWLD